MNLEDFLNRVVAPGNWLAIAYKGEQWRSLAHRFFERGKFQDAAGYLRSLSQSLDTWFAVASFDQAALHSNGKKFIGKRTRENAYQIKSFWADADIKAAHDNKDPTKVFASEAEVVMWATAFAKATGVPMPNIWIKSGYGLHIYWSFEDALDVDTWRGYAEALKAALIANNFKGDVNVVADAARILRPPETQNFKVPATPVACFEFYPQRLTQPDYPNVALLPILGKLPTYKPVVAKPTTTRSGSSIANARAGFTARPRDFEIMAANCAQVRESLDTGGEHDTYDPWWRMLKLAEGCDNGRHWAHEVSKAHPKYTQADTDKKYDEAVVDHQVHSYGWPQCTVIDAGRAGICAGCRHWNPTATHQSPLHFGLYLITGSPDDLPEHWRRENDWIEQETRDKKGNWKWRHVWHGDVTEPSLFYDPFGPLLLTFTATTLNNPSRRVSVNNVEINKRNAKDILCARGMNLIEKAAVPVYELLMAWIDKLQRELRYRSRPPPSFGWHYDGKEYLGFSAGGVCHRADGMEEQASNTDPVLISRYTPTGTLADWRAAAEFAAADCPELHTIIAMAFGAPLMELEGGAGAVMCFVGDTAVGKTSAIKAGQAVWGHPVQATFSVDDTSNYKNKTMSDIHSLPVYWDEAKIVNGDVQRLISEIHKFTQGRDKGRLNANLTTRDPGEWSTLYCIAKNDSLRDLIVAQPEDVEPTLMRLLEIDVVRPGFNSDSAADSIIGSLSRNYGEAGRVYAQYIAQNTTEIKAALQKMLIRFKTKLDPSAAERFYMASAATITVGAAIATQLGIITLDVKGIFEVLVKAITSARVVRDYVAPIDPTAKLMSQIDAFLTHYQGECVVSKVFKKPGQSRHVGHSEMPVDPQIPPKDGLGIAYHISIEEKALRINKHSWDRYWGGRGSASSLRAQVEARWHKPGVTRGLGHGSRFPTNARVFDLTLGTDLAYVLDPYIDDTLTKRVPGSSTVIPMPTRP